MTAAVETTTTKRCALYRHFDADNVLLYVGISETLVTRGKQHAAGSEWVKYATRAEAVWYPNRTDAEAAEREAIRAEHPIFNIQHNNTNEAALARHRYLAKRGAGGKWIAFGELVDVTTKTYADCPGVEFRNFVAQLPVDRWLRYPRVVKVEIDDEARAAQVLLDRDYYFSLCGGDDLAAGADGADEAYCEFTQVSLEKIYSTGKWLDRTFSYSAGDELVATYVPLDALDPLLDAINTSEANGDLSGLVDLTESLRASIDRSALALIRAGLRTYWPDHADDGGESIPREPCCRCRSAGAERILYAPKEVEPLNPWQVLAVYECRSGHRWASRLIDENRMFGMAG